MSKNKQPYKPTKKSLERAIYRQANRLFPENEGQKQSFINTILSGDQDQPALFWTKDKPTDNPISPNKITDWQPDFVDVYDQKSQPGKLPLYEQGYYYCLDFSSILSISVLKQVKKADTILDLCSSPGGKGIFAYTLLKPELLVCNEVIGKRLGALTGNLKRCEIKNSVAIRQDPKQIEAKAKEAFDLVLVDAPCSGQSLVAKGEDVPGAFADHMISMNMTRQRRILVNAKSTVKPGGYLAYMTCTYSKEENEKNVEWFLRRFTDFEAIEVPHLKDFQSPYLNEPCYRHHPGLSVGVGGFAALLKRKESQYRSPALNLSDLNPVWQYR